MEMAVSAKLLDDVKTYCKIEDDDMDVQPLTEAAVQKMEIETGKIFKESQPLCVQIVKMLVEDWYDHRGSITTENIKELPMAIGAQVILNQIAISSEFEPKPLHQGG